MTFESIAIGKVVVVGLGYVGLPLAVALARKFDVTGLDIDSRRIDELLLGHDRTKEVDDAALDASSLHLTSDPADCRGAEIYIVTVPTPVDMDNRPDLGPLRQASITVGGLLPRSQSIVVFESTVYPGVTEEICGPLIAEASGLECGRDFLLGYSPERINPGDREHTIERIVKVVSGQTPEVVERLAELYGAVSEAGVFRAASIKAAEAAKVIENAQRDINIAFMNEITQIFALMDLSIWDVLEAAETKWNFQRFRPGLVGGHCIGVDPYYLSFRAGQLGHHPKIILAGRSTNDGMSEWIADRLHAHRAAAGTALVLGISFKENVPDLRNSRAVDLIRRLEQHGHNVTVHDNLVDSDAAREEYGIELNANALERAYDLVVVAVPHEAYCDLPSEKVAGLILDGGTVADLQGIWRRLDLGSADRWSL